MHSDNLSQIALPNIWLLVQISSRSVQHHDMLHSKPYNNTKLYCMVTISVKNALSSEKN